MINRRRLLLFGLLAGLLTGCALMVKQSAFDAGLAVLAYLVITERRRVLPSMGLFLTGIGAPIAAGVLTARSLLLDRWNP